jgi:hypothetical protein
MPQLWESGGSWAADFIGSNLENSVLEIMYSCIVASVISEDFLAAFLIAVISGSCSRRSFVSAPLSPDTPGIEPDNV